MSENKVVESIKEVAKNVLPENAVLLLYCSRARVDYSEDSDWYLLVILDEAKIEQSDYDNIVLLLVRHIVQVLPLKIQNCEYK